MKPPMSRDSPANVRSPRSRPEKRRASDLLETYAKQVVLERRNRGLTPKRVAYFPPPVSPLRATSIYI